MALENLSKEELLEYIRKMRDRSLSDTTHVSETDQGYNSSDDSDDRSFVDEDDDKYEDEDEDEDEEEGELKHVSSVCPLNLS
jgi:hypothetical protein